MSKESGNITDVCCHACNYCVSIPIFKDRDYYGWKCPDCGKENIFEYADNSNILIPYFLTIEELRSLSLFTMTHYDYCNLNIIGMVQVTKILKKLKRVNRAATYKLISLILKNEYLILWYRNSIKYFNKSISKKEYLMLSRSAMDIFLLKSYHCDVFFTQPKTQNSIIRNGISLVKKQYNEYLKNQRTK